MTTRPDQRYIAMARLCENLAHRYPEARTHLTRELTVLDGHPAATMGDGTSRSTSSDTPVERVGGERARLTSILEQMDDDRAHLPDVIAAALTVCNQGLGVRAAGERPHQAGKRCNARIDPLCTNYASDHIHPDDDTYGTVKIVEVCDACWSNPTACPSCRIRPAETRRSILFRGEVVPGCEACSRKQRRQASVENDLVPEPAH